KTLRYSPCTPMFLVALCLEPTNPCPCRRRRQSPCRLPMPRHRRTTPLLCHSLSPTRWRHLFPSPRPKPNLQTSPPAPCSGLLNRSGFARTQNSGFENYTTDTTGQTHLNFRDFWLYIVNIGRN